MPEAGSSLISHTVSVDVKHHVYLLTEAGTDGVRVVRDRIAINHSGES